MKDITLTALTPKEATDMLYAEFGIFCDELEVADFEKGPGYYEVVVGSRGEIEDVYKTTEEETYKAVESAAEYAAECTGITDDDIKISEEFYALDDSSDFFTILGIEEELGFYVVRIAA